MNKIIGISGVARSGKDTLYNLLEANLRKTKRFALADNLKKELNPFFISQYGIDIFNCTPEQKELLRPILVAHGKMRRLASKGQHWTGLLQKEIEIFRKENPDHYIVITDIRYDYFPNDEVDWIKKVMGGTLVHISRYKIEQVYIPGENKDFPVRRFIRPPNQDEEENDPKIKAKANYLIEWPTVKNDFGRIEYGDINIYAEEFIKYLHR